MSNVANAFRFLLQGATIAVAFLVSFVAVAGEYPTPKEGDWIAQNFGFHTGEVMQNYNFTTRP